MLPTSAWAVELDLPAVFSDHMVLQRQMNVPIWGKADPGSKIDISFAGQSVSTQADETGNWRLQLNPMEASAESRVLTIEVTLGDQQHKHEIKDVLVGEVWLAGGQSNMYRPFRMLTGDANQKAHQPIVEYLRNERDTANDPLLRQFRSGKVFSVDEPQFKGRGGWSKAVPGDVNEFSGTAYFFARELRRELNIPVAFLSCNLGGTLIEAWMPRESFETTPELKEYYRDQLNELQQATQAWDADLEQAKYKQAMDAWKEKKEAGKNAGREPRKQVAPQASKNVPCTLYNGIVHPVATYGIRGFIWYQGESNSGHFPEEYGNRLVAMINAWRSAWGNDDLHFFWCQLASYKAVNEQPVDKDSPSLVKNGQQYALKLPNTGMAVLNDVGDYTDVHPKNKIDAGKRLSLWALNKAYGKQDVVFSGPLFREARVQDNKVVISFDHATGGLMAGKKTFLDPVVETGEPLQRFQMCGPDGKWFWANAEISGTDSVTAWHPKINQPTEVRYAWSVNADHANLYNKAGLPASLFKTPDLQATDQPQTLAPTGKQHLFIMTGQSNMKNLDLNLSFTPTVEAEFGKENVMVIKDSQGGRPIRQWYKAWQPSENQPVLVDATPKEIAKDAQRIGTLYDRLMEQVKPAMAGRTFETVTFCWMQGEKDAKQSHGSVYAKSLQGLINQLSNDLGRDDINFVIGRLSDFAVDNKEVPDWNVVRAAQVQVADASPRGAWVDTDDLNDGLDKHGKEIKNDLHYSVEGYKVFGKRLADKAIELIKAN